MEPSVAKVDKQIIGLENRVFETTKCRAFATLKDHKLNFQNNPKLRLINAAKPEIGKIAKQILENIN